MHGSWFWKGEPDRSRHYRLQIVAHDFQNALLPDGVSGPLPVRVTIATKRVNGFFREIELLENRIFNPPRTIYFNYSTFNVSHTLRSTKNASKD